MMGQARSPEGVKLIASILGADEERLRRAESLLAQEFGLLDYRSELLPFTHTDYYTPEFGAPLVRVIVAFEPLMDPELLPVIKHRTNELEGGNSDRERRWVNIDPGYVSLSKLVLATTKNHSHRIYLRDGIYAEVTLRYQQGTFRPWPWTYPDYASPPYIAIFNRIRHQYHRQLRSRFPPSADGEDIQFKPRRKT
ncbi:MAG: DUF4416 family protein [Chloroflexota bacterium]|nr:DUF4416 family protein [Chloroflexota bacterium]